MCSTRTHDLSQESGPASEVPEVQEPSQPVARIGHLSLGAISMLSGCQGCSLSPDQHLSVPLPSSREVRTRNQTIAVLVASKMDMCRHVQTSNSWLKHTCALHHVYSEPSYATQPHHQEATLYMGSESFTCRHRKFSVLSLRFDLQSTTLASTLLASEALSLISSINISTNKLEMQMCVDVSQCKIHSSKGRSHITRG
ncbi:hypothetical protein BR93DRAFT_560876 [Coniochaeta sp. PMI_546]|nr:hypothetical protein BR93DRAFT_560876 [Coniochaeta sp. PMI_546]